ncbi:MAG: cobalt-precorrin-5B (C(1))-methyltransferase, partial [Mesorhizobium sp.]
SIALVERIRTANTVSEAFQHAAAERLPLGDTIAARAWPTAAAVLGNPGIALEILVFDREGRLVGHQPFRASHSG